MKKIIQNMVIYYELSILFGKNKSNKIYIPLVAEKCQFKGNKSTFETPIYI
jgi:hypothetical protein